MRLTFAPLLVAVAGLTLASCASSQQHGMMGMHKDGMNCEMMKDRQKADASDKMMGDKMKGCPMMKGASDKPVDAKKGGEHDHHPD